MEQGQDNCAHGSTCIGKLLKLAALAIQELLNSTWPSHFGNRLAPTIWKDIHRFFEATALDDNLVFLNHDLVGFFNSIPQSTILSALQSLMQDFLSLGRSETLMVDLHSTVGPVHAGKSRFSVKANQIEVNMVQLMDIIQFSFSSGCFTTLGKCYRQVQGTSMGNQVSPILSSLSIVAFERAWLHTHATALSRLRSKQHNDFLGFNINPLCREITYLLKTERWRYRLPHSAGSQQLNVNLSGYRSRRQLISKLVSPGTLKCRQMQDLRDMYSTLGFDVHRL